METVAQKDRDLPYQPLLMDRQASAVLMVGDLCRGVDEVLTEFGGLPEYCCAWSYLLEDVTG
jgi:hypothetical protein